MCPSASSAPANSHDAWQPQHAQNLQRLAWHSTTRVLHENGGTQPLLREMLRLRAFERSGRLTPTSVSLGPNVQYAAVNCVSVSNIIGRSNFDGSVIVFKNTVTSAASASELRTYDTDISGTNFRQRAASPTNAALIAVVQL